jgi:hypothetical protein
MKTQTGVSKVAGALTPRRQAAEVLLKAGARQKAIFERTST